jgi:ribose transport system permease protein
MTTELTPTISPVDVPPTPVVADKSRSSIFKRVNVVRDILPLAALLALTVYFSVRAEAFLSAANLTLISGQAGILLLASLGATLVIIAGSVDLSVGSIALLTGAVLASLIDAGIGSPVVVLLIAVAVGAAIGLLNGVVFAYGRVPSFIATLGTLSLFAGIGLTIL